MSWSISASKWNTVPSYRSEADQLDADILAAIERDDVDFNELALRIFAHQLRYNRPYARYCASFDVTLEAMPPSWEGIVPVPSAAFKDATLATFDVTRAALCFETSGTTRGESGRHYMESSELYDASLLAGFERLFVRDGTHLQYLCLVTNPSENQHSSLGYMMREVGSVIGAGETQWFLRNGELDVASFERAISEAIDRDQPVCLATTAFALVHVLDALEESRITYPLPEKSRIMETGGFKGRSRIVERRELYARACEAFSLPQERIIAEYGMTELTSQYYDDTDSLHASDVRYKISSPWLRARVVGPDGKTLPDGTVGSLVHVDLANRASCIAISTEDLGVAYGDRFVLLGREQGARLRGCSLTAEDLVTR
jgi:hypothetical protein